MQFNALRLQMVYIFFSVSIAGTCMHLRISIESWGAPWELSADRDEVATIQGEVWGCTKIKSRTRKNYK